MNDHEQLLNTPFDPERIPARWVIVPDPTNQDRRAIDLQYRPDGECVTASITFEPEETTAINDAAVIIEVQDESAGKTEMGRLNPQAKLLKFEDFEAAVDRFYELATEYPLTETRTPEHIDGVVIRSPMRPLTRSARRDIEAVVNIVTELDSDENSRNGGFVTDERPPDDILEQNELTVDREPAVVYNTDGGRTIEVYTDPNKIVKDDQEGSNLTPTEVVEKAENMDHFTRLTGTPEDVTESVEQNPVK